MLQGENPRKWASKFVSEINKEFISKKGLGNAIFAAERLAITEMGRIQVEVQVASYEEMDLDQLEIITEPGACKRCLPHDGEIVRVKDAKQGVNIPMFHPFCRCSTAPFMDRREVERTLAEHDSQLSLKEKETERSHKNINRDTQIKKDVINSSSYDEKFSTLNEDMIVQRSIKKEARKILNKNSGTKFESLVFIDGDSGKALVSHENKLESIVGTTKAQDKMLKDSKPNSVIAMHNHPESTIPSYADIKVAYDRKYKYGLTLSHDGSVFKYSVYKPVDEVLYSIIFDKLYRNGYNEEYKSYLKQLGINMEEL